MEGCSLAMSICAWIFIVSLDLEHFSYNFYFYYFFNLGKIPEYFFPFLIKNFISYSIF